MNAAGALLFSGRLTEPSKARVVRMARDRVVTTDGPYLETKEILGGFYIIDAEDLDAALSWASKEHRGCRHAVRGASLLEPERRVARRRPACVAMSGTAHLSAAQRPRCRL